MAASKETSAIISTEGRENKQFKYTLMENFPKTLITELQGAIKKNSEYCDESIVRYSGRWGDKKKKKKKGHLSGSLRWLVWQSLVVLSFKFVEVNEICSEDGLIANSKHLFYKKHLNGTHSTATLSVPLFRTQRTLASFQPWVH